MNFKLPYLCLFCLLFLFSTCAQSPEEQETYPDEQIEAEILAHGQLIRQAFADSDIEQIKALHHPEVLKALGYNDIKAGRAEVVEGIRQTLESFTLEFVENEVESILIQNDLAIEQTKFAIKGTPKAGGDGFRFEGRTMVTYLRYEKSPSGWDTIREIIQPASN